MLRSSIRDCISLEITVYSAPSPGALFAAGRLDLLGAAGSCASLGFGGALGCEAVAVVFAGYVPGFSYYVIPVYTNCPAELAR